MGHDNDQKKNNNSPFQIPEDTLAAFFVAGAVIVISLLLFVL